MTVVAEFWENGKLKKSYLVYWPINGKCETYLTPKRKFAKEADEWLETTGREVKIRKAA